MAITSMDIQNQSFSIDRKGYDVDEVDVFLERVADEIDALNYEIEDLRAAVANAEEGAMSVVAAEPVIERVIDTEGIELRDARIAQLEAELGAKAEYIASLEERINEKPAITDSAIAQALIVAQRSADEVVANANTQSEQIISDAHADADNIIAAAQSEKDAIDAEIVELKTSREEARSAYQELLRNFINDATLKLGSLEEKKVASMATASPSSTGRIMSKNQIPVADKTAAYVLPTETVQAAAVMPTPSGIEKDLSGFGDADDFAFGEVD